MKLYFVEHNNTLCVCSEEIMEITVNNQKYCTKCACMMQDYHHKIYILSLVHLEDTFTDFLQKPCYLQVYKNKAKFRMVLEQMPL